MANVITNPASAGAPAFGLYHDEWGQLVLIDADGVQHEGIMPIRMFPFADPMHWLSLVNSRGKEIVCVENLADLASPVWEILERELSRREFVPVIRRIYRVSSILEPCDWDVETDRGRITFVLKSEEDVRRLGPNQALVLDSYGIRFLIADLQGLDAASQTVLERYV